MEENISRTILSGWRVLVVDDDPSSLDIASTMLRAYGAEVHEAKNGKEALALLDTVRPAFIVSDLMMPEMDGWQMVKAIKNNRATLDIPVIALTAGARDEGRKEAISAGFHNYLTKPLTPRTFVHDLLNILMDIPDFAGKFEL